MAGNSGVSKVARVALPLGRRLLYILMTALAVTFAESTKMRMALAQWLCPSARTMIRTAINLHLERLHHGPKGAPNAGARQTMSSQPLLMHVVIVDRIGRSPVQPRVHRQRLVHTRRHRARAPHLSTGLQM